MTNRTDQEALKASYLAFLINDFILTHLRRTHAQFDGDIESALILGEIAHYNVRHVIMKSRYRMAPIEVTNESQSLNSGLSGCNALSISAATGIARETVRRKIKTLEERGWVTRDDTGELIVTLAASHDFADFNQETVQLFLPMLQELNALLHGSGEFADGVG